MTTVLIIGGQGALGSITADVMRECRDLNVLIGGRRRESRPDFRYVDLGDSESIGAALEGVNFAISTVADPHFELERVAVEKGARTINISSAVLPIGGHVSLRGRGLSIVHVGLAPIGLQALIAKDLLKRHPEAARIEVAMCFSASGVSGPQGREFAYTAITREPFEPSREIPFSAPVGTRRCFSATIPDREILGALAPDIEAGIYFCFAERTIHGALGILRSTGLIRAVPRALFVGSVRHSTVTAATDEPVRQWVAVYDTAGKRLGARITEGRGDYRVTAIVTRAFLYALMERLKTRKPFGVHSAERMFDLADITPYLGSDVLIRDIGE